MKTLILGAGAAAMLLAATPALAASKGAIVAAPKQPIPYSQLNAYLKASPKQRASKDWWAGASTGASTDTAATTPAMPRDTPPRDDATTSPSATEQPTTSAPQPSGDMTNPDAGKGDMSTPPANPDKPK